MRFVDLTPKPKLRKNVDIAPVGNGKFVIRDLVGYADNDIVVDQVAALAISFFDGTKTPSEIASYLRSLTKANISEDEIRRIVDTLDVHGFLDSPNFILLKAQKEAGFRTLSERPCRLAGKSFPDRKDKLEKFILTILESFSAEDADEGVFAVISPHIEITNGINVYGKVWKFLKNSLKKPDVFFLFGTSHAYSDHPIILTDKNFQTPLGSVKTDKEMVAKLKDLLGDESFRDEIIHKTEHSIEFQVIFIKYIFPDAKIVPILCSGSWLADENEKIKYDETLDKIYTEVISKAENFVLVAAADLAHIGTRFGDDPVSQYDISITRLKDYVSLQKFAENRPNEFLESIMFDQNRRKVCGVAPIYSILRITQNYKTRGKIIAWDILVDATMSAVSFGAAYLSKR